MSPHQRWLILAASVVKSRRIASARAAAAGSGMVVFFHRFGARPLDVALLRFLRLDERVAVHRLSLTRRKPSPA